jgi:hypothetical protein
MQEAEIMPRLTADQWRVKRLFAKVQRSALAGLPAELGAGVEGSELGAALGADMGLYAAHRLELCAS